MLITTQNAARSAGSAGSAVAPDIIFNENQQRAIDLALNNESFCLIGAAGTGKTTTTQTICRQLMRSTHVVPIAENTKWLRKGAPGIVIVSYTNKAINHLKKKVPSSLQDNCITIHKLLEFAPVFYDAENGDSTVRKMVFEPSRTIENKLPHISTLIFEESSQIGLQLYGDLIAALENAANTQLIFLGDLHQLPPVRDKSILGIKQLELPIVELTEVYRQALNNPIIKNATSIRNGINPFGKIYEAIEEISEDGVGKLVLRIWNKRYSEQAANKAVKSFFEKAIDSKMYDPENDMILCPFNVNFGTLEINKAIASHLTKLRNETTWEVLARYQRTYWAVGDRVYVNRYEGTIRRIYPTPGYLGKIPRHPTLTLDRWGIDPACATAKMTPEEILALHAQAENRDEESKNKASHTIEVFVPELNETMILNTAGEINKMILSYALSVHKAQGQEWDNVFLYLHRSHSRLLSRELLYTAITRAKKNLFIVCEGDIYETNSIDRALARPIIPGVTLEEKMEYFRKVAAGLINYAENAEGN